MKTVGVGRLRAVHANDSKDVLGSCRDRHENLGTGKIGLTAFSELLAHPAVQDIPVLIETPGDRASDAREIALLKELRDAPARKSSPATSTTAARS